MTGTTQPRSVVEYDVQFRIAMDATGVAASTIAAIGGLAASATNTGQDAWALVSNTPVARQILRDSPSPPLSVRQGGGTPTAAVLRYRALLPANRANVAVSALSTYVASGTMNADLAAAGAKTGTRVSLVRPPSVTSGTSSGGSTGTADAGGTIKTSTVLGASLGAIGLLAILAVTLSIYLRRRRENFSDSLADFSDLPSAPDIDVELGMQGLRTTSAVQRPSRAYESSEQRIQVWQEEAVAVALARALPRNSDASQSGDLDSPSPLDPYSHLGTISYHSHPAYQRRDETFVVPRALVPPPTSTPATSLQTPPPMPALPPHSTQTPHTGLRDSSRDRPVGARSDSASRIPQVMLLHPGQYSESLR
jgi:cell division septation protein DedD